MLVQAIRMALLGAALSGCAGHQADLLRADQQARLLPGSCARPVYPQDARLQRQQGAVRMAMLVGADGKVVDAAVKRSSGSEALDLSALRALSVCSFRPASLAGQPVQQWTDVQYVWKLG